MPEPAPVRTHNSSVYPWIVVALLCVVSCLDYLDRMMLAIAGWSLPGIVGWIIVGWLPTCFKEHFDLSQTVAGVYATGYHQARIPGGKQIITLKLLPY